MARFAMGVLVGATVMLIAGAAAGIHAADEGGADVDAVDEGTTVEAPPTPAPVAVYEDPVWEKLAGCESSHNWHIEGRVYSGGLQFDTVTWLSMGGGMYASRAGAATREQQIRVAERLRAIRGYQPWPACSRMLGLR